VIPLTVLLCHSEHLSHVMFTVESHPELV